MTTPIDVPTIKDVADRAGVSITTVSQAFGGRRPVSPKTREKVLAAAREVGYEPNPAARFLRTGRSGILGLILRPKDAARGAQEGAETFPRLAGSVATYALDRGQALVHVPDLLDADAVRVSIDGCIVAFPYGSDFQIDELVRRGTPIVLADVDPDRPDDFWAVELDHAPAIFELLDGLEARGAKRIEFIGGTQDNSWNRSTQQAYRQWSKKRKLSATIHPLAEGAGIAGAEELLGKRLTDAEPPDAIIGGTSRFAVGAAREAQRRGLTIPDDLMVAALTEGSHNGENLPRMTAVDLHLEELGRQAMALLEAQLSGEPQPVERPKVLPTLSWRKSTDRPVR